MDGEKKKARPLTRPLSAAPLLGYTNVVSVPDGAPRDVKEGALPDPEEDVKFSYLWASRGVLDMAVRIIIATDSDGPGQALSEELARRLGRERCWRVKWPPAEAGTADAPVKAPSLKDANEVLMAKGPDALKAAVEGAEPYPIRGLFRYASFWVGLRAGACPHDPPHSCGERGRTAARVRPGPSKATHTRPPSILTSFLRALPLPPSLPPHSFADFESEIWASYVDQKTDVQGVSTGWEALDGLYRVSCVEGALHVRTPPPGPSFSFPHRAQMRALNSALTSSISPQTHTP